MHKSALLALSLSLSLTLVPLISGCTTVSTSAPSRTAMEQMLISTAAERASSRLTLQIPATSKVFIDTSNFEGTDNKYAMGAIKSHFLQMGTHIVDDKKEADTVVEIRAGALSIDHKNFLIGVPSFNVPVPFASTPLTLPEIALYSSDSQKGVAKFADDGYRLKLGTFIGVDDPQYGFSQTTKKTVMFFFSWTDTDAMPDYATDEDDSQLKPAKTEFSLTADPQIGK